MALPFAVENQSCAVLAYLGSRRNLAQPKNWLNGIVITRRNPVVLRMPAAVRPRISWAARSYFAAGVISPLARGTACGNRRNRSCPSCRLAWQSPLCHRSPRRPPTSRFPVPNPRSPFQIRANPSRLPVRRALPYRDSRRGPVPFGNRAGIFLAEALIALAYFTTSADEPLPFT